MSAENVEAMRRGIQVWNQGNFDAYMSLIEETAHPDLEWFPVIAQLVEGKDTVYRGIDGMRRFWKDWHDVFDFRFDDMEIRDLGETLVVLTHASVTGRGSGVDLTTPLAMVISYEDGLMFRSESYLDHDEALRAAEASA